MNAQEYIAWEATLGPHENWTDGVRDERFAKFSALPLSEKYLVHRRGVEEFFIPENARHEQTHVERSPSDKYALVITPYSTKPGAWDYSLGEIYREVPYSDLTKIAEIRRNYRGFWCAWIENHPLTGHDYLLTGEDYQGFTVVNLTTGVVSTHIPDAAFRGYGWCPTSAEVFRSDKSGVTLKVDGCYWACPYEIRIYDFSNPDSPDFPEKGLRNLTEDLELYDDELTTLTVGEDGAIVVTEHVKRFRATGEWEREVDAKSTLIAQRVHKARKASDAEKLALAKQEEEHHYSFYHSESGSVSPESAWEKVPNVRRFLVPGPSPEGGGLGNYQEDPERAWKSDYALAREAENEEWERNFKLQLANYSASDPLYQLTKKEWPDKWKDRSHTFIPSMVDRWDGDENPLYFFVEVDEKKPPHSASMKWGAEYGPLTLTCRTQGEPSTETEFPRTEEGWWDALSVARKHLSKGS